MSFPKLMTIAHAGGEFLSVNLSGLKNDDTAVLKILDEATKLITKPSTCRNIGLHLYDTRFTIALATSIINWIIQSAENIHKLAVIGLSVKGKYIFKKVQKKQLSLVDLKLIFSLNKAKDWLVGHIE